MTPQPTPTQGQYLRSAILLIEDNPDAVALTRRAVQKVDASIRLITTDNVDDAMDAFMGEGTFARENTSLPFLVLFDLKITGNSGLTLLRHFRANPVMKHTALVVVSASATAEEAKELLSEHSPADAFILKPISTTKMAELIERYQNKSVRGRSH